MKKIPKFWKIYIFTVTVVIILCCIFLVFLGVYLNNYEQKAQAQKADMESVSIAESESDSLRESEEYSNSERESIEEATDTEELMTETEETENTSVKPERSPSDVMNALLVSLYNDGISAVSEYLEYDIGKYESAQSVIKYIDGLSGGFSYKEISEYEFSLIKDTLDAKVTLKEDKNEETGQISYSISSVSVSLPHIRHTVIAPENARLTVNGTDVDDQPVYEKQSFADSIPSSFSVPLTAIYELEGFIYRPEIKAYINDEECTAVNYEYKTVFSNPQGDSYRDELFDRICELSFAYSDFVAGAFKFEEMSPFLYPGTKLYRNLSGFDNRWYYEFHHIVNENAKITDFTVLTDNLVSAHITFNQSLRNEKDRAYNDIKIELTIYVGCDRVPNGEDKSAWLLVSVE